MAIYKGYLGAQLKREQLDAFGRAFLNDVKKGRLWKGQGTIIFVSATSKTRTQLPVALSSKDLD